MANVFELIQKALDEILQGDPPPPKCIVLAKESIKNLSSISLDFTQLDSISRWFEKWRALIGDEALRETILVRIVQLKLPRVAEALTLLGLIEYTAFDTYAPDSDHPEATVLGPTAFKIRWKSEPGSPHSSLSDFFDSSAVSDPSTWLRFLIERLGENVDDAKESIKFIKVLLGVGIVSPLELLKLEYKKLGFTSLPRRSPVPPEAIDLLDLLNRVNSPFVLPLQDMVPSPTLAQLVQSTVDTGFSLVIDGQDLPTPDLTGLGALKLLLKVNDVQSQLVNQQITLPAGWSVGFQSHQSGAQAFVLKLSNNGRLAVEANEKLTITLGRASSEAMIFGGTNRSHLSLGRLSAELALSPPGTEPVFQAAFRLSPLEIVLSSADIAGPLIGVKPPEIRLTTDVAIAIDTQNGLGIQGGGLSFSKLIPLGIEYGPVKIPQANVMFRVKLNPELKGLELEALVRVSAQVALGPISLGIENAGIDLAFHTSQNAGLSVSGAEPTGLSIAIDAPPISGGGFISHAGPGEYAGGLSLKLLGFGISAYGIYKDLQGEPSFVAIIGIRFPPPGIQLSWGFALSGVGGLAGVNRRANAGLLAQSLASGATGNVLFNDNPAANAPALVNDLRAFFPEARGVFLVGPTLQITWGVTLVSLDIGLFIELPGPSGIYLIGSARVMVGVNPEVALIYLRMDFFGGIDFTAKLIRFDAALVNSHVLQIFRITGGVALRISYGNDGFFLLSIGGFHPAFHPTDMQLPQVARAGAYLSANVGAKVWLKLESYFAITPNTLQLGSGVEAGLEIGPLEAHGWFRFDALIQFKPFHFDTRIDAGFDVSFEGASLCGVRVQGLMSGPGPIVISAKATVHILFVSVSGHVTLTLGSDEGDRPVTIPNLIEHLKPKFKDPRNYSIHGEGEDRMIVVRPRADMGQSTLLSPVGSVVWDQRLLPLARNIQRFDGQQLEREARIDVVTPDAVAPLMGEFSAITYTMLDDSSVLNHSRFTREQCGVILSNQEQVFASITTYSPKINVCKITGPRRSRFELAGFLVSWSGSISDFRQERRGYRPPAALADGPVIDGKFPRPAVKPDRWKTVGSAAEQINVSDIQALTLTRSQGGFVVHATEKSVSLGGMGI